MITAPDLYTGKPYPFPDRDLERPVIYQPLLPAADMNRTSQATSLLDPIASDSTIGSHL